MTSRLRATILLVLAAPLALSGCAGLAEAIVDIGACRAAAAVTAADAGDGEALSSALTAFAAEAPSELQPALAVLGGMLDGEDPPAIEELAPQADALTQTRRWVAAHCEAGFALGTLPPAAVDAAAASLEDHPVIVGTEAGSSSVAVLGAGGADAALALCGQAADEHPGSVIRVFGPRAALLASTETGACVLAPGLG